MVAVSKRLGRRQRIKGGIAHLETFSEVRGKCKWEVEHEGKACNRAYVCSWCKAKDLKPLNHQKRFCRRRAGAEEGV